MAFSPHSMPVQRRRSAALSPRTYGQEMIGPKVHSKLPERSLDIAARLQSSLVGEGTDDSLKDEDNLAWLLPLDSGVVSDWLTVLEWVRVADRLIENDRYSKQSLVSGTSFATFRRDWESFRLGSIPEHSPFRGLFARLRKLWTTLAVNEIDLVTWDAYLDALERYTTPKLRVESMEDFARMLYGLSGTFFQALPYSPRHLAPLVGQLGVLDQFYNNLRDLGEDLRRGIVCFPLPLLRRFGLSRAVLLGTTSKPEPRLARLIDYLIREFALPFKETIAPLVEEPNLHPSWQACLHHTLNRYARIEDVLRDCDCCPDRFSANYWPLVAQMQVSGIPRLTKGPLRTANKGRAQLEYAADELTADTQSRGLCGSV